VLAALVVGLAEEVVDPLEEVLEGEALGQSLAGLAVVVVIVGDGSVEDFRRKRLGDVRDLRRGSGASGSRGVVRGVVRRVV